LGLNEIQRNDLNYFTSLSYIGLMVGGQESAPDRHTSSITSLYDAYYFHLYTLCWRLAADPSRNMLHMQRKYVRVKRWIIVNTVKASQTRKSHSDVVGAGVASCRCRPPTLQHIASSW